MFPKEEESVNPPWPKGLFRGALQEWRVRDGAAAEGYAQRTITIVCVCTTPPAAIRQR